MIIYNVSVKVNKDIANEWLSWLQNEHLADVLGTGKFTRAQICKLLDQDETDGIAYVIQYYADNYEQYKQYVDEHSDAMRKKGYDKFGNQFIAFRTIMELIQ